MKLNLLKEHEYTHFPGKLLQQHLKFLTVLRGASPAFDRSCTHPRQQI